MRKTGKFVKCNKCSKKIYIQRKRFNKKNIYYCSLKCRRTYKIVKCAYCGNKIKRKACRIRKRNYCNASHQLKYEYKYNLRQRKPSEKLYKAHKEKCSGSNNHKWKGGKKKWKLKIFDFYYQTAWQELRMIIYKRDKWTCQICGVHCGKKDKIQCHHIIPYRISQDNSPENLITLCVSCHRREELKYYRKLREQKNACE